MVREEDAIVLLVDISYSFNIKTFWNSKLAFGHIVFEIVAFMLHHLIDLWEKYTWWEAHANTD